MSDGAGPVGAVGPPHDQQGGGSGTGTTGCSSLGCQFQHTRHRGTSAMPLPLQSAVRPPHDTHVGVAIGVAISVALRVAIPDRASFSRSRFT